MTQTRVTVIIDDRLGAARVRGRKGGRRPKLDAEQVALAQQLFDVGEKTLQQISDLLDVPLTTIYGHLIPTGKGKRPATTSTGQPTGAATDRAEAR